MKRSTPIAALLALALAGALQAGEAARPKAEEASIPFLNMASSIREWQADREEGVWVMDARRQWYYAKLMAPCHGLDFAVRLGFQTRGTSTLDKFGYVIVPGEDRCPIQSFVKSDPPPDGKRHKGEDEAK